MKRLARSILGVTLLEVMLVLAIAAMIIVMSIRYYQSASANQQANGFLAQIQSIVAAAEQMAQATGSYANAVGGSGINTSNLAPLLPANSFTTPWGASISMGTPTASAFQLTVSTIPASVCQIVYSKLSTNNHFSGSGTAAAALPTCTTSGWNFFYISNP
ncbi:MAG: hypothetical protein JO149_01510 [Gammaproteobacteria bacterium]|nr:hypothetical protein [Gammaproteobacteria bacterium]